MGKVHSAWWKLARYGVHVSSQSQCTTCALCLCRHGSRTCWMGRECDVSPMLTLGAQLNGDPESNCTAVMGVYLGLGP